MLRRDVAMRAVRVWILVRGLDSMVVMMMMLPFLIDRFLCWNDSLKSDAQLWMFYCFFFLALQ